MAEGLLREVGALLDFLVGWWPLWVVAVVGGVVVSAEVVTRKVDEQRKAEQDRHP